MSIENELKLIPHDGGTSRTRILEALRDNGYTITDTPKVVLIDDIYYDDQNRKLLDNGSSLRIRRSKGKVLVTYKIKLPSSEDVKYKQRDEFEEEIPAEYIKRNGEVAIEDAIKVLKAKYPELEFPEGLQRVVHVRNNRNKINVKAQDGSTIEAAFDDLYAFDEYGNRFTMKNEMEFEALSGNPDNLNTIYEILNAKFDVEKNDTPKYARAVKEMIEQKQNMSLEEITLCAMLSDIIGTREFNQLKYKGQILHDYRVPMPPNLDLENFKDPSYLISKISAVKRVKGYNPGRIRNLEDMFSCYFSDMSYQDIEYKLIKFLNEYYHDDDQAITNRLSHSQQVMLITGLISRSREISEQERKPLLCMVSALIHDIGHVPGAHPTEALLGSLDGFFSHESNGRTVVERIITDDMDYIVDTIKQYCNSVGQSYSDDKIREMILKSKIQLKKSIESHSRTNSEKRGEGTVVQLPREADKICYGISDIVDIIKRTNRTGEQLPEGFLTQEWKEKTVAKLGKGYAEREEIIRKKIEEFEKLIRTGNFGELTTEIANTVRENVNDGRVYYDVEQDTWDILNGMIDYVKGFRKTGIVDGKKKEFSQAAMILVIKTFNEAMAQTNGNVEDAWELALAEITRHNDLDVMNMLNEMHAQFERDPEGLKKALGKGGILDPTNIEKLDNADRQIKIHPRGMFGLTEMLPFFGEEYRTPKPDRLRDTYFSNDDGLSVCLREYVGTMRQELIVKRKREKGVMQVEREKFVTEDLTGISLPELIEKFNTEHSEFNVQIPNTTSKCMLNTIRTTAENEDGVALRIDKTTIIGESGKRIPMEDTIEIECSSRDRIKKARAQLLEFLELMGINPQIVLTKRTKEEEAMDIVDKNTEGR